MDQVYCHEIARRSVARVALHLGIEALSEESLDVMADILMSYLHRVGQTMSKLVEASGRSSSHANVLDAIQAIKLCTSPAVNQLHPSQQDDGSNDVLTDSQKHHQSPQTHTAIIPSTHRWQDLAVFCFGPKWTHEKPNGSSVSASAGAGGKSGPSSASTASSGWIAPYLEEVPPFPEASEQCANPHQMKPYVGLSLHNDVESLPKQIENSTKEQLRAIPDKVFTSAWGGGPSENPGDRKRRASRDATEEEPSKKKAKINDQNVDESTKVSSALRPYFIPTFLPPYPESSQMARSVVDLNVATTAAASSTASAAKSADDEYILGVRSSLVDQSHQYWGSGWDGVEFPSVPLGRTPAGGGQASAVVVPLGRPSGSRVSRILEGSM